MSTASSLRAQRAVAHRQRREKCYASDPLRVNTGEELRVRLRDEPTRSRNRPPVPDREDAPGALSPPGASSPLAGIPCSDGLDPSYDVYIVEQFDFEPEPGRDYAEDEKDVWWSGGADSPEAAVENCNSEWRWKHGEYPPGDVEVKVELGPNVCPHCEGRGWGPGDTYGLADPGDDSPLGSTAKRICNPCAGTGNVTQRR